MDLQGYINYLKRPRYTDEVIKGMALEKFQEVAEEDIQELLDQEVSAKTQRELDFYKNYHKEHQKNRKFVDEITQLIKDNIKPINQSVKFTPPKRTSTFSEEKLLCMNSDQHIGFIVDELEAPSEEMVYNPDVARKRIDKYTKTVLEITEFHRKFENVDDCYLVYLGDGIEGDWKGLNMSKDNIVEQYLSAFAIFTGQIETFARNFRNVFIHCIHGNHTRMDKGHPEYVNWEYILWSTVMKEKLAGLSNVTLTVPSQNYGLFDIYSHKFCTIHGGGIKMTYRTPYYGIESARKDYQDIFEDLEQGRLDYLLMGHFHNPASLCNNTIKMCGSTVGFHPWSLNTLRKYCKPSQKMCYVHEKHGVIEDRDIDVRV